MVYRTRSVVEAERRLLEAQEELRRAREEEERFRRDRVNLIARDSDFLKKYMDECGDSVADKIREMYGVSNVSNDIIKRAVLEIIESERGKYFSGGSEVLPDDPIFRLEEGRVYGEDLFASLCVTKRGKLHSSDDKSKHSFTLSLGGGEVRYLAERDTRDPYNCFSLDAILNNELYMHRPDLENGSSYTTTLHSLGVNVIRCKRLRGNDAYILGYGGRGNVLSIRRAFINDSEYTLSYMRLNQILCAIIEAIKLSGYKEEVEGLFRDQWNVYLGKTEEERGRSIMQWFEVKNKRTSLYSVTTFADGSVLMPSLRCNDIRKSLIFKVADIIINLVAKSEEEVSALRGSIIFYGAFDEHHQGSLSDGCGRYAVSYI